MALLPVPADRGVSLVLPDAGLFHRLDLGDRRQSVVKVAFVVGVVAGPLLAVLVPGLDILIAGLGGGTLAYLFDRYVIRRGSSSVSAEQQKMTPQAEEVV